MKLKFKERSTRFLIGKVAKSKYRRIKNRPPSGGENDHQ